MDKPQWIEKVCEKRERCSVTSANTHFLTIARAYRISIGEERTYKVKSLPKTHTWVKTSLIEKLKTLELVPQRNIIVSMVVYLQTIGAPKKKLQVFTDRMYEIVKDIKKNHEPHKRSEKQKERWISKDELECFFEKMYSKADVILKKRRNLSQADKQTLRDAIILTIHCGKGVRPPRLDWSVAIWTKNEHVENEETAVFRKKGVWKVAIYGKTKTTYNQNVQTIHNPLAKLLTRYFRKFGQLGSPVFLTNRNKPFTRTQYGAHLQKLFQREFGKNTGASILRSIFVTNKYGSTLPALLREFEKDARCMGHSLATSQNVYMKCIPE